MQRASMWQRSRWLWHSVGMVAILLGLVGTTAVASAATSATITLFAPGAPVNGTATVEWLDPLTGTWPPVQGWTTTLSQAGSGAPVQTWAVYKDDYGLGPFRWVVTTGGANLFSMNGIANMASMVSTEWGESSPFMLPVTDGVDLKITVLPAAALAQLGMVVSNSAGTKTIPAANPNANQSCVGSACASFIEATFTG